MTNFGDKFNVTFFGTNWVSNLLNNWVNTYSAKMGGQFGDKIE